MKKVLQIQTTDSALATGFFKSDENLLNEIYSLYLPSADINIPLNYSQVFAIFEQAIRFGHVFDHITIFDGEYSQVALQGIGMRFMALQTSTGCKVTAPIDVLLRGKNATESSYEGR